MAKTSNKELQTGSERTSHNRVIYAMAATAAIAVVLSSVIAPWRVTSGLLLGGALSMLNYHWMHTSITAAFAGALQKGNKPSFTSVKYILRYFVIAAAVFAAHQFNLVSLPATIAGLCSFVVALFVEALIEFYFVIIQREETS
ncbi:MAG TPA: ATP synthase subunit I [Pyrinomonadaceae bacterium]|nr:ATP synthase subunit I [Pyrinomonadaceae bacterium]